MIRISVAVISVLMLAACGGGSRYSSANASNGASSYVYTPVPTGAAPTVEGAAEVVPLPFATGPIFAACQADNRKAASRARCGCVQAVADQSLSLPDQKRGAKYFKDPHALQEVRQSDNAGNERFWKAWKAYGQEAAAICSSS